MYSQQVHSKPLPAVAVERYQELLCYLWMRLSTELKERRTFCQCWCVFAEIGTCIALVGLKEHALRYSCVFATTCLTRCQSPRGSGGTAACLLSLGRISRMYVSVFVFLGQMLRFSEPPIASRESGSQVCRSMQFINHESITVSLPISIRAIPVHRQPTQSDGTSSCAKERKGCEAGGA
jgi:hypothetical protein